MSDEIQRSKVTELRAKLDADRKIHESNLHATTGAIQALDLILAPEAPNLRRWQHSDLAPETNLPIEAPPPEVG